MYMKKSSAQSSAKSSAEVAQSSAKVAPSKKIIIKEIKNMNVNRVHIRP